MSARLSSLATLATLADQLGDCTRYPGPCDCLTCAADRFIELGVQPVFQEAVRRIQEPS